MDKVVFLIGCQRSGTTWLQLLLYQHPSVASSQETHFADQYLRHLEERWRRELNWRGPRRSGLSKTLSQDEFDDLLRGFATGVLNKIASSKAGASVVVEKTPDHIHHWPLLSRLFPDAYFLHVIRDPRSVVCSLRSAGQSWGAHWAPTNVIDGATLWTDAVRAGQELARATGRYKEIRYEDLLSQGPAELNGVLSWLGIEVDHSYCEKAIAACDMDNLRGADADVSAPWTLADEPKEFYRQGHSEGWRKELSPGQLKAIEYVTGDLLEAHRYARAVPKSRTKPLNVVRHDAAARAKRSIKNTLAKLSPRAFGSLYKNPVD